MALLGLAHSLPFYLFIFLAFIVKVKDVRHYSSYKNPLPFQFSSFPSRDANKTKTCTLEPRIQKSTRSFLPLMTFITISMITCLVYYYASVYYCIAYILYDSDYQAVQAGRIACDESFFLGCSSFKR